MDRRRRWSWTEGGLKPTYRGEMELSIFSSPLTGSVLFSITLIKMKVKTVPRKSSSNGNTERCSEKLHFLIRYQNTRWKSAVRWLHIAWGNDLRRALREASAHAVWWWDLCQQPHVKADLNPETEALWVTRSHLHLSKTDAAVHLLKNIQPRPISSCVTSCPWPQPAEPPHPTYPVNCIPVWVIPVQHAR